MLKRRLKHESAILNRIVSKRFMGKVTFEQTPEPGEGKGVPGRDTRCTKALGWEHA